MSHVDALRRIVALLEPPPYGREWCESPCCCTGDCVGCLAEAAYEIARAAIGADVVAVSRDFVLRWQAAWMGVGLAIEKEAARRGSLL